MIGRGTRTARDAAIACFRPAERRNADAGMALEILPLGDAGLIVRVGDSLGEVLTTARKLEAARIPGVIEIAPAFASVGVFLASPASLASCAAAIPAALRARRRRGAIVRQPRAVEVPVCYDPQFALDLETVAQHCDLSPNEIVERHAAARYQVRCVGFIPGFPYLSGLPSTLATPRRATPRTAVPAGSVAIGGGQTGIYPLVSPGGWNIIGRTPLRLFDVEREPAVLLAAGDRVRFVVITPEEFAQWAE
jgi:inhibitor of KinA